MCAAAAAMGPDWLFAAEGRESAVYGVCMADMDNILLMICLFFAGFFELCSIGGCWPERPGGEQATGMAGELPKPAGSPRADASRAAARCLLVRPSGDWPVFAPPPAPAPNSCEAVNWRWNRRGPVAAPAGLLTNRFDVELALLPKAVVLNWRWNIELAVNLDCCCSFADELELDDNDWFGYRGSE